MAKSKLVDLLIACWDDADRVYANLSEADAKLRTGNESTFGWTLGHISGGLDRSFSMRAQGKPQHAFFAQEPFKFGVPSYGTAPDFAGVQKATKEVRAAARAYLEGLTDADLERIKVPPLGTQPEANLRYLVMRAICHHYFHIGEVAAKRDRLGHKVGDYPGPLAAAM
jgi:uncharacterized damage-inducible protein DinB